MLLLGATKALEKDKAKGESQRASLATHKYSHIQRGERLEGGGRQGHQEAGLCNNPGNGWDWLGPGGQWQKWGEAVNPGYISKIKPT